MFGRLTRRNMGEPYKAIFPQGSKVRVASRADIWKKLGLD
jgi:hypothetical protein